MANHNSSSDDSKKESTTTVLPDRNSTSSKKLPLRDHQPKKTITHRTHTTTKSTTRHVVRHRDEYKPAKKKVVIHKAPVKKAPAKTTRGYYIKVGTFKDPSTAIKHIKANHLKYKTVDTANGMSTRVYVGPYYSQKDAQKNMATVRANIAKDAFITKL
ncbi:MAG TPA: SPOR domain-containing protein [Campylobacterales bacterium]|nr:SPOR domain-containing protein [Campylobacterales bacterium]